MNDCRIWVMWDHGLEYSKNQWRKHMNLLSMVNPGNPFLTQSHFRWILSLFLSFFLSCGVGSMSFNWVQILCLLSDDSNVVIFTWIKVLIVLCRVMLNLVWCESFTQIWIQNSSLNLTDAWYFIIHIFLLDKIWSLIVDIFGLSLVSFVCQLSCFSDIINNLTVTHWLLEDRDHISCTSFGEGWVFFIYFLNL